VPSGAACVRREWKHCTSWAIKYRDAAGRQVGRRSAASPSGARRGPSASSASASRRWNATAGASPSASPSLFSPARYEADYLPGRDLKPSTVSDYGSIIRCHFVPYFGHLTLAELEAADVDGYVAAQTATGLSPKTIRNHLGLLGVMLKVARRWRLQVAELEAHARARAAHGRHAPGAVAGEPLPGRRVPRVLSSGARLSARPEQAVAGLHAAGASAG
jgi:hypothetical protein